MLELDAAPVCAAVVDDYDADVLERPLENAPAAFPGRARRRQLVQRVGPPGRADAVDLSEDVVERTLGCDGCGRRFPQRCRHRSEFTPRAVRAYRPAVTDGPAMSLAELMERSKLYRFRKMTRAIPRAPRCKLCNVPFAGIGRLFRLAGFAPSRKNPNMCNSCFERAPVGGSEVEIGVLFADVRGYTSLVESSSPEQTAELLKPFYRTARDVLLRQDAVIDKLVGDEVMALFIPLFAGENAIEKMVAAGVDLLEAVGPQLPVGAGADFGRAFVGNVGEEDVKDFTALGDVVNTAARLQARAEPGQLLVSERVYEVVSDRFPDAEHVDLDLKGKAAPVGAHVIETGLRVTAPT